MRDADNLLDRCRTELGDPDAVYFVTPGRFWAKLGVGLFLFVGGLAGNYAFWVHGPAAFGGFLAKLLIAPPIAGIAMLWHLYRTRGLHVLLYPTGLLRLHQGVVESYPWDETTEVTLKADKATLLTVTDTQGRIQSAWLSVETPTFQLWNAVLSVKRQDEATSRFTPALSEYEDLVERVQRATFPPRYQISEQELDMGNIVIFGPIEVSAHGLTHAGKLARWPEIGEVKIGSKQLTIKRKGGWLAWANVVLDAVPNPHVLLALIENRKQAALPDPVPSPAPEPKPAETSDEFPQKELR